MFKRIRSKIGIKLLIAFSLALILSMVFLIYIATQLVAEFGEFSASKNEANIKDNTSTFLSRITHEQAMRYESTFQKIAAASSLIAKQASSIYAYRNSLGEKPLTPCKKLVISPKNGIFSNGPSERTMVLYWGSSTISPAISRQITALSKLDLFLENSKESNPESVACSFVSESAIARYYPNIHGVDDIPSGFDIRKAHWYVKARPENNPERKTVWSNVYLDIVGHGLMTTASSPVYNGAGQYLGAAGIDVTLDSIVNDILSDIKLPHRMENMFSFLVDSTGKIIAFPPEYLEMFDLKIDTAKLVDSSVILEKSLLESSNAEVRRIGKKMIEKPYLVSEFSLNGHAYIFSSHFMPSTGWRLGVVVPESVVFASVQETRNALGTTLETMTTRFTIVALSFLLGTIIIMILFTVKNIIRPINNLSKAALRVREGDLTIQVDLHREDEIGTLAYSFNNMVAALRKGKELEKEYTRKLEKEVEERTLELKDKNEELENTLRLLKQEMAERKRAEEELQKSEARYRSVFDSAGTATVSLEEDMTISVANTEFEKLSGYSREEIEGKKKWTEFVDTENLKSMKEYHAIRRSKESEALTEHEFRFIDRQGNVKNIFLKIGMIPGTERSVASLMDITARKRAEEALRESETQKKAILDASIDRIRLVDTDMRIIWANKTTTREINIAPEDLLGQYCYKAFVERDTPCLECPTKKALDSGKIEHAFVHQKKSKGIKGESYWDDYAVPIKNESGEIVNLIEITRDITARKQAEEQIKASLKEKEVLLKEIHHRVKNNLQVIASLLSLQSHHIKDKEALEIFKESQDRVRSMALIHEKLYQSDDMAHIDIASYIQDLTASLFSAYTVHNAIKVTIAVTDIFLTITTAIPCGLIINELVSNALKYAFPEEQDGTITVSITPSNKDSLILTVSDTGIGFPEGIDFRNTTTLGMQLVTSLVEQLEGTITLDRGEGTIFTITFRGGGSIREGT